MRNGKYTARRSSGTKVFALVLSLVLIMGCAIGGTLAWLTAQTATVTNTFTVGDINIDLKEHKYDPDNNTLDKDTEVTANNNYKMVPGYIMPKDPFVTVKANSEPCYVFIKVDKKNNFDDFMTYAISGLFTQLKDGENNAVDGVYYMTVDSNETDQDFYILSAPTGDYDDNTYDDGYVEVKNTVTKAQLDEVGDSEPAISFTAYAIQKFQSNNTPFDPYVAWTTVYGAYTDSTT